MPSIFRELVSDKISSNTSNVSDILCSNIDMTVDLAANKAELISVTDPPHALSAIVADNFVDPTLGENIVDTVSSKNTQAGAMTVTGEKEKSRADSRADVIDVTPTVTQSDTIRRVHSANVLKSNHEPPRLSLKFDREDSGKSIVFITMNDLSMHFQTT